MFERVSFPISRINITMYVVSEFAFLEVPDFCSSFDMRYIAGRSAVHGYRWSVSASERSRVRCLYLIFRRFLIGEESVMMLYYLKVQKFGMVSLTGLICGILMLLTGMGYWSIITGAVFGVLADLVLKSGDYKSKKGIISHGVFSMWIIGNYIPIVATRDSYYQQLISGYGQEYADSIMSYIFGIYAPPFLIAGFVCGVIGGVIGQKIFKKQF